MDSRTPIQRALDYMEENLTCDVTPAAAARAAGYSLWHFARVFRAEVGLSPADYIRRRRISEIVRRVAVDDRPHGSPVKNSALTSTGLVPFMERYSNSTREVAQDGRRGALMLSVSVKHPDSEAFIDAKMEQGKVTGANVSVKMHDDFMEAAINNLPYVQKYPIDAENPTYT